MDHIKARCAKLADAKRPHSEFWPSRQGIGNGPLLCHQASKVYRGFWVGTAPQIVGIRVYRPVRASVVRPKSPVKIVVVIYFDGWYWHMTANLPLDRPHQFKDARFWHAILFLIGTRRFRALYEQIAQGTARANLNLHSPVLTAPL